MMGPHPRYTDLDVFLEKGTQSSWSVFLICSIYCKHVGVKDLLFILDWTWEELPFLSLSLLGCSSLKKMFSWWVLSPVSPRFLHQLGFGINPLFQSGFLQWALLGAGSGERVDSLRFYNWMQHVQVDLRRTSIGSEWSPWYSKRKIDVLKWTAPKRKSCWTSFLEFDIEGYLCTTVLALCKQTCALKPNHLSCTVVCAAHLHWHQSCHPAV